MWIWEDGCWHAPCNPAARETDSGMLTGALALRTSPACLSLSLPYLFHLAGASEPLAAPCPSAFIHTIPSTRPLHSSWLCGKHELETSSSSGLISFLKLFWNRVDTSATIVLLESPVFTALLHFIHPSSLLRRQGQSSWVQGLTPKRSSINVCAVDEFHGRPGGEEASGWEEWSGGYRLWGEDGYGLLRQMLRASLRNGKDSLLEADPGIYMGVYYLSKADCQFIQCQCQKAGLFNKWCCHLGDCSRRK